MSNSASTFAAGGGKIITDVKSNAQHVIVQSDGKILVSGRFGLLERYNIDGSLDTTFSVDGKFDGWAGFYSQSGAYSIAVQADGKIVMAGDSRMVRVNTDGYEDIGMYFSEDYNFGTRDGLLTTPSEKNSSVALQPDGKILVLGQTGSNITADLVLMRYNTDGSLDTSFSGDGKLTTDFMSSSDSGRTVVVQTDGKILVAASSQGLNNGSMDGRDVFALARYNTDGSLDNSFSGDGKLTFSGIEANYATDISAYLYSMTTQGDDKILVVGAINGDLALVRFNTCGTLDTSFSGDGIVIFRNFSLTYTWDATNDLLVQPDGKILVVGAIYGDFALVRFNTDGTLDTSFSGDGIVTTDLGIGISYATGITLQSDGKIVVSGCVQKDFNSEGNVALARYNPDGSLDSSITPPTVSTFTPTDGATGAAIDSNIVVTFIDTIQRGAGKIEIHTGSATGPLVTSYDAATSGNLSISGDKLTIHHSDLANNSHYFVTIDAGSITDLAGNSYAGTVAYDFTTVAAVSILGTSGNDTFYTGTSPQAIDGGLGFDTVVFNGIEANYAIALSGTGFSIHDNSGHDGTVTETNVEKLQFTDHTLNITATPDTTLSEAYRIYKAAFDRAPDYGGLGFWYKGMAGGTSLNDVALGFTQSKEFTDMYGTTPTDANFLTLLYQHVLGRTYDQGGYDWWLNTLATHANTQANVLAQFSESAENIAHVAGVIANGIIYEAYAG